MLIRPATAKDAGWGSCLLSRFTSVQHRAAGDVPTDTLLLLSRQYSRGGRQLGALLKYFYSVRWWYLHVYSICTSEREILCLLPQSFDLQVLIMHLAWNNITLADDLCFSNNNTAAKFLKGVLPSKHLLSNVWIRVFGARRFLDRVIIITCECNQSLNFTVNTFTSDSWKRVAANSCKENKLVTQLLYSVAVLSTQSIDIYSLIYHLELNKYQFFIF